LEVFDLRSNLVDSRVLRNKSLQTPSDPEGSSGSKPFCVPQGSLAINKLFLRYELIAFSEQRKNKNPQSEFRIPH